MKHMSFMVICVLMLAIIILDYNKNEIYAKGIDSARVYSHNALFLLQALIMKLIPDSIRFNFETEKALIYNSRTESK